MTTDLREFEAWWRSQPKSVTKPITPFQIWQASRAVMKPMTEDEARALIRKSYEAKENGDEWLVRAVEAHHGIGVTP